MASRAPDGTRSTPQARSWRATTAARASVIALATGQALSAGEITTTGVVLLALAIVAAISSAVELEAFSGLDRWTPLAEGVLAAALIGTIGQSATPLLVYVAVPPVIAGVRHGWVSTVNTALATGIALAAATAAAHSLPSTLPQLQAALPWLWVGTGVGLLAAWFGQSLRHLEDFQAPYAAAHRLLSELRSVSAALPNRLDSTTAAQNLAATVTEVLSVARVTVLTRTATGNLLPLAVTGSPVPGTDEDTLARRCADTGSAVITEPLVALPLRLGDHVLGAVALTGVPADERHRLTGLQRQLDDLTLELDTALLFDDVRHLATTEERHRLAREIHDGIAQEIASLGYLVDDLAANTIDPEARGAARELRREVSRVVNELRLSIFDLRHAVDEKGGLAAALAEYVRQVRLGSDLQVHLRLDDSQTRLPARSSEELLRIAQEAVANVRKHAHAGNLWVTLTAQRGQALLCVEDDGVGDATPKASHYGLRTMAERARRINADFSIAARSGGGTVVTVQTESPSLDPQGADHDARAARR